MKPGELQKLQGYDTVFVLDDSESMSWSMDQSIADAQWAAKRHDKEYKGKAVGLTRWDVVCLFSFVQAPD